MNSSVTCFRSSAEALSNTVLMRTILLLFMVFAGINLSAQSAAELIQFAQDALTRGEVEQALQAAKKITGRFPSVAEGFVIRSQARERSGDISGALTDMGIAMELAPSNPEYRFNHGLLAYQAGRLDLARSDFRRLIRMKRAETGMVYYRQNGNQGTDRIMTMQGGIDDQLLHYLGLVELKSGNFDRAVELLDSAIALNRSDADLFAHRGLAHEKAGRHEAAGRDFDQAFRIDPDHAVTLQNRSAAALTKGQVTEAEESITSAIRSNPRVPDFYAERGQIRLARQDFRGALSDYDSAILMDSENAGHYLMRGAVHEKNGVEANAIQDYRKAIALSPDNPQAWFRQGNLLLRQRKVDDAINDFNQAIMLDSTYAACWHNRAIAHFRNGNKVTACRDLRKAIGLGQTVSDDMRRKICGN